MTRRRFVLLGLLTAALLIASAGVNASPPTPLQVAFINVGQGDATLIRNGDFAILIDGGRAGAGPTVVAYLRQQGITDLDVLLATHADTDHIGGLIDVLNSGIPVHQALYNGYAGTTATWATYATAVAQAGVALTAVQFPQVLQWGEMTAYVLNPVPGLPDPDQNDVSVVLRLDHGAVRYVLPGDVDTTVEAAVVARGTPVAAQILKASHHGSQYGSGATFLAAVQPQQVVISVGPNSYGHPAPEMLTRVANVGATVWRTDQSGTITVGDDGNTYWVQAEVRQHLIFLPWVVSGQAGTATPSATWTPTVLAVQTPTPTATHTPTPTPTTTLHPTSTPTPTSTSFVPGANDLRIVELVYSGRDEYIAIRNNGPGSQELTGWRIVSVVGTQTYYFPAGYTLGVGATVRVHSGPDALNNPPADLRWSTGYIWNSDGDKAELQNASGMVVDSRCYGAGCP